MGRLSSVPSILAVGIGTTVTVLALSAPSFAQTTLYFSTEVGFIAPLPFVPFGSPVVAVGGEVTRDSFITVNQFTNRYDDFLEPDNILNWSIQTTSAFDGSGGFLYTPQTSQLSYSSFNSPNFDIRSLSFSLPSFPEFPESTGFFPSFILLNPLDRFLEWRDNNVLEDYRTVDNNGDGIPDGSIIRGAVVSLTDTPPPPGTTPDNPVLPIPDPNSRTFIFPPIPVVPNQLVFFDPDIAVGYEYAVTGGPLFASVLIPGALPRGDSNFLLELPGFGNFPLVAGTPFNLLNIDPDGFDQFQITGIDQNELLDPTNPVAFVTGLEFTAPGTVNVTQTPIIQSIPNVVGTPEPSSVVGLVILGGGLVLARRWK